MLAFGHAWYTFIAIRIEVLGFTVCVRLIRNCVGTQLFLGVTVGRFPSAPSVKGRTQSNVVTLVVEGTYEMNMVGNKSNFTYSRDNTRDNGLL